MADLIFNQNSISFEEARELADRYLRGRYYDFDKIHFGSHAVVVVGDTTLFRLYGSIRVKSRSLLENIGFARKTDSYKCVLDIDSLTGKIVNYEFT